MHRLYKKSYSPYTQWPALNEYFLKLPDYYSFDLEEMKQYISTVVKKVGLSTLNTPKHPNAYVENYRGLGFTFRKFSSDPHHDAFKIFNEKEEYIGSATDKRTMNQLLMAKPLHYFEKNFTERTEFFAGPIENLISKFHSPITKVRLIELGPGASVHEHFDYPYYENIRLQAVIESNEDVTWWVENNSFKIPSDGNLYWFDTGRFHRIENRGKTPRLMLCIHLSLYKDLNDKLIYGPENSFFDLVEQLKL